MGVRHEHDRASTLVGLSVGVMVPEIEWQRSVTASSSADGALRLLTDRASRAAAFLKVGPVGTTTEGEAFWS